MFIVRNLGVFAFVLSKTMWQYNSTDSFADVTAEDYMDGAADMLSTGDSVFIAAADGCGLRFVTRSKQTGKVVLEVGK